MFMMLYQEMFDPNVPQTNFSPPLSLLDLYNFFKHYLSKLLVLLHLSSWVYPGGFWVSNQYLVSSSDSFLLYLNDSGYFFFCFFTHVLIYGWLPC